MVEGPSIAYDNPDVSEIHNRNWPPEVEWGEREYGKEYSSHRTSFSAAKMDETTA